MIANLFRQAWRSLLCWLTDHIEPEPDVWHLGGIFTDDSGTYCAFERPCARCGFVIATKWGMDPAIANIGRREGVPIRTPDTEESE